MTAQMEDEGASQERANERRRVCILVAGMHRSGTSALTRVLGLMGADLPRHPFEPNEHNETGYWESEPIVLLHEQLFLEIGRRWDDLAKLDLAKLAPGRLRHYREAITRLLTEEYGDSRLFVVKDPRVCLLAPLWSDILAATGIDSRFVLPIRNAVEVARSLERRDGRAVPYGCLLWLRHVLEAEHATRGHRRAFVTYDDLLNDPAGLASGLDLRLFDGALSADAETSRRIGAFVDPGLRHNFASAIDAGLTAGLGEWLATVGAAHMRLLSDPEDGQAKQDMDAVRGEFDRACAGFLPLLDSRPNKDLAPRLTALEQQNARLEAGMRERVEAETLLARRVAEAEATAHTRLGELNSARSALDAVYRSSSWRLTGPMRAAARLFAGRR